MKSLNDEMERILKNKDATIASLGSEYDRLQNCITKVREIVDEVQNPWHDEMEGVRLKLEAEVKSLKTLNDEQTELLNNKRDEIERLGHELKALQEKVVEAKNPWYPEFVKTKTWWESEVQSMQDSKARMKSEVESLKSENDELKVQIKSRDSELKYIREQIIGKSNKEADDYDGFSSM